MAIMSFTLIYCLILFLSFLAVVIGIITELPLPWEGTVCRSEMLDRSRDGDCLIRSLILLRMAFFFGVLLPVSVFQIVFLSIIT